MSDKVTWEDIQDAFDKLNRWEEDSNMLWDFYVPVWYRWKRSKARQMKAGCHGGGRVRHKHSTKARSRHFVCCYPTESNGYFT